MMIKAAHIYNKTGYGLARLFNIKFDGRPGSETGVKALGAK